MRGVPDSEDLQTSIDLEVEAGPAAYDELVAQGLSHAEIATLTLEMAGVAPEDFPQLCHDEAD